MDFRDALESDKARERKDGIKKLKELLNSAKFQQDLDKDRRNMRWTNLFEIVIKLMKIETETKKAHNRKDAAELFLKSIRAADTRSSSIFLAPSVRSIVTHIRDTLRNTDLADTCHQSYLNALKVLISKSDYCSRLRKEDRDKTLVETLLKLLTRGTEHELLVASILSTFVERSPFDALNATYVESAERIILRSIDGKTRLAKDLLPVITTFFLRQGINQVEASRTIAARLLPHLVESFKSQRDVEMKERIVTLVRAHVRLAYCFEPVGDFEAGPMLEAMIDDIGRAQVSGNRNRDERLEPRNHGYFDLMADLLFYAPSGSVPAHVRVTSLLSEIRTGRSDSGVVASIMHLLATLAEKRATLLPPAAVEAIVTQLIQLLNLYALQSEGGKGELTAILTAISGLARLPAPTNSGALWMAVLQRTSFASQGLGNAYLDALTRMIAGRWIDERSVIDQQKNLWELDVFKDDFAEKIVFHASGSSLIVAALSVSQLVDTDNQVRRALLTWAVTQMKGSESQRVVEVITLLLRPLFKIDGALVVSTASPLDPTTQITENYLQRLEDPFPTSPANITSPDATHPPESNFSLEEFTFTLILKRLHMLSRQWEDRRLNTKRKLSDEDGVNEALAQINEILLFCHSVCKLTRTLSATTAPSQVQSQALMNELLRKATAMLVDIPQRAETVSLLALLTAIFEHTELIDTAIDEAILRSSGLALSHLRDDVEKRETQGSEDVDDFNDGSQGGFSQSQSKSGDDRLSTIGVAWVRFATVLLRRNPGDPFLNDLFVSLLRENTTNLALRIEIAVSSLETGDVAMHIEALTAMKDLINLERGPHDHDAMRRMLSGLAANSQRAFNAQPTDPAVVTAIKELVLALHDHFGALTWETIVLLTSVYHEFLKCRDVEVDWENIYLNILGNSDARVRCAMRVGVRDALLFNDAFTFITEIINGQSWAQLGTMDENATISEKCTRALCMSELIGSDISVSEEAQTVTFLVQLFPKIPNLVTRALKDAAIRVGYESPRPMLEVYLDQLVQGHLDKSLKDFPISLFDAQTLPEFIRRYRSVLVPFTILSEGSDTILRLWAKELNTSSVQMIKEELGPIFAHVTVRTTHDKQRSDGALTYIKRLLAGDITLASADVTAAVLTVTTSVAADDEASFLQHTKAHVLSGLRNSGELTRWTRPYRVQHVFLRMNHLVATAQRISRRLHYLRVYDFLAHELFAEHKKSVCGTKLYLYCLIRALPVKGLSEQAIKMLKEFVETPLGIRKLTPHLPAVVSALVSFMSGADWPVEQQKLAFRVLEIIIITHEAELTPEIAKLDPFPKQAEFDLFRAVHTKVASQQSVRNLLLRVADSSSVVDQSSLETLFEALKNDKKRFVTQELSRDGDALQVASETIAKVVWQLIQIINTPTSTIKHRVVATDCLGELGVVPQEVLAVAGPSASLETGSADGTQDKIKLMQLLNNYLVHPDTSLAMIAGRCYAYALWNMAETTSKASTIPQAIVEACPGARDCVSNEPLIDDEDDMMVELNEAGLWSSVDKAYESWALSLVSNILRSSSDKALQACRPLARRDLAFAEAIFPVAFAQLQVSKGRDEFLQMRVTINDMLRNERELQAAVVLVLNGLQAARRRSSSDNKKSTGSFDEYIIIAKAALRCHQYYTALLYVEFAIENVFKVVNLPDEFSVDSRKKDQSKKAAECRSILFEIFRHVNDPDGIYGVNIADDNRVLLSLYEHEHQWVKVLTQYNSVAPTVGGNLQRGLVGAMQNLGMGNIQATYLRGLAGSAPNDTTVNEMQYESAWRCGQWDSNEVAHLGDGGFHGEIFRVLKAVHLNDFAMFDVALDRARTRAMNDIGLISREGIKSVHPFLVKTQFIRDIQRAHELRGPNDSDEQLLTGQLARFRLMLNDFEMFEPLIALHKTLLRETEKPPGMIDEAVHKCSTLAREAGRFQLAMNSIQELNSKFNQTDFGTYMWRVEAAKTRWDQGERDVAVRQVRHLVRQLEVIQNPSNEFRIMFAQLLRLAGEWLAEARVELPKVVTDDYLLRAVNEMEGHNIPSSEMSRAHEALSKYAAVVFRDLDQMVKSPEWQRAEKLHEALVKDLAHAPVRAPGEHDPNRKRKELHEGRRDQVLNDRSHFLMLCLESCLKCLTDGPIYDVRVFRLCSLWFQEKDEGAVNDKVAELVREIPSHKFLPLIPQLASQLQREDVSGFQRVLRELVVRVTVDHPHHCVWQLVPMMNDKAKESPLDPEKVQAIKEVVKAALGKDKRKKQIIEAVRLIVFAYTRVAETNTDKNLTAAWGLEKVDTSTVALPTVTLPVDPTCRYETIVGIHRFEPELQDAPGGINKPKIATCYGSNGLPYQQLVKTNDDMRQDAVMQQVFSLVNELLVHTPSTRRRRLRLRTYKVFPTSPRTGFLEWVEGSMSLSHYLVQSAEAAHTRFRRSSDLTHSELAKAFRTMTRLDAMRDKFKEATERFLPVFHHFFLEHFLDPVDWFEKRLAYTRSVATSSMIGYIVGLGDRHSANMLIDTRSGELIHIDFGVAFEQGMLLRTPELVPFRLTRDIVDGMGATGYDGAFRRCAEETMSVLRQHQDAITTVMEVLMNDPLYTWTVSETKSKRVQRVDSDAADQEENGLRDAPAPGREQAERVMLRIRLKLNGNESGDNLSVSGQVNRLISEATDHDRLCRMFHGWAAWL